MDIRKIHKIDTDGKVLFAYCNPKIEDPRMNGYKKYINCKKCLKKMKINKNI